MLQLANERQTVSVVDDQFGQPTWTVALADLIIRLVEADAPYGIHHGTSSGHTTWYGLARAAYELSGLDPERILPTQSSAFPRPAQRPAWGVLSHHSLEAAGVSPIEEWHRSVTAYVKR
jgi:dTDP-4-dehydrorhamnose reductase